MIKSALVAMLLLWSSIVSAVSFQVANTGPVTGYFAGSTAVYSSFMNAKFNIPQDPNPYDNPYVSNHVAIGTNYFWGNYEAGTEVFFVLRVMDTHNWFFSNTEFNNDGVDHLYYQAFTDSNGVPSLYVGFEDIYGGGDRDFNDNSIIFQNVTVAVPEPETYAMLLAGLGLIGFSLRKRGGGGGCIGGGGGFLGATQPKSSIPGI